MKNAATRWTCAALTIMSLTTAGCGLLGRKQEVVVVSKALFQPFGADYRGISLGSVSQQFDDQATQTDFTYEYYLRADVAASGDALEAAFVLDSVVLLEGTSGGVSEAQVDSARGSVFRANFSRSGHATDFAFVESSGTFAREIADRLLKPFLPTLPVEGAEAGSLWSDTVETLIAVNGIDNSVRLINDHAATEWTVHAGTRALHIRTISNYTFSGIGLQAGREFTIEGNGRRFVDRYVADDGRYLGFVSADTSDGEARLTEMGLVIPIHQTRIDSLTIRE